MRLLKKNATGGVDGIMNKYRNRYENQGSNNLMTVKLSPGDYALYVKQYWGTLRNRDYTVTIWSRTLQVTI